MRNSKLNEENGLCKQHGVWSMMVTSRKLMSSTTTLLDVSLRLECPTTNIFSLPSYIFTFFLSLLNRAIQLTCHFYRFSQKKGDP